VTGERARTHVRLTTIAPHDTSGTARTLRRVGGDNRSIFMKVYGEAWATDIQACNILG